MCFLCSRCYVYKNDLVGVGLHGSFLLYLVDSIVADSQINVELWAVAGEVVRCGGSCTSKCFWETLIMHASRIAHAHR
jgi:hypothetical protein